MVGRYGKLVLLNGAELEELSSPRQTWSVCKCGSSRLGYAAYSLHLTLQIGKHSFQPSEVVPHDLHTFTHPLLRPPEIEVWSFDLLQFKSTNILFQRF